MAQNISKIEANRVRKAVVAFLGTEDVTLYGPGFHASGWTLALEGDYDWPILVSEAVRAGEIEISDAVFVEPVSGWALGLYPA